jgi:hypothetical protein
MAIWKFSGNLVYFPPFWYKLSTKSGNPVASHTYICTIRLFLKTLFLDLKKRWKQELISSLLFPVLFRGLVSRLQKNGAPSLCGKSAARNSMTVREA